VASAGRSSWKCSSQQAHSWSPAVPEASDSRGSAGASSATACRAASGSSSTATASAFCMSCAGAVRRRAKPAGRKIRHTSSAQAARPPEHRAGMGCAKQNAAIRLCTKTRRTQAPLQHSLGCRAHRFAG
jgi:hypothetical protein